MILSQLAALALAGPLDRLRGDPKHIFNIRLLDKVALGYAMAVVAGFALDPIVTPLIVLAMVLGMSFGWGAPMGAALTGKPMDQNDLEWWQFGVFKKNAYAALALRGVIWGLPVAIVGAAFSLPVLYSFLLAYGCAFPASVYLARGSWARAEWIRGYMAALIVFGATFIL